MKAKIAGLFMLGILLSSQALAHSPSGIYAEVDFANNQLYITVAHPVSSASSHYVNKIEVIDVPELESVNKIIIRAYSHRGGSLEKILDIKSLRPSSQDSRY
jgi:hypothetical protein